MPDEPNDVLRIFAAVGVVGDAAAFVGADLVLIDDPFERGAIAQAILKHFGRRSLSRFIVCWEDSRVAAICL